MLLQGMWNWHLLGQAMEDYLDSIKYYPEHQHPWTNLAYVYNLIGEKQKAKECLERSFKLASPGPNHPGRNYNQVKFAIDNDSYLSEEQVDRPPVPDWFRRKYMKFLR